MWPEGYPKKVTFSNVTLTLVILTIRILIPVQVKRGAPKGCELLLCVSPAWRAIFFRFYQRIIMIFTKRFKTCDFGKSIVLIGQHESRSRTGPVVKNWFFCVVTGNECILTILLLAWVRVHFVHCSGSSRGLFERHTFKQMVQIIQQNVCFC